MNPQVGHELLGEEEGAQMMQLSQVQLAQVVSSAVSQSLTQHMQHTGSNPPLAAVASSAAAQQVQSPTTFEILALEGDSGGKWLTWSQRVVYQAGAYGFETELTADEGEGLSVRAEVFLKSGPLNWTRAS